MTTFDPNAAPTQQQAPVQVPVVVPPVAAPAPSAAPYLVVGDRAFHDQSAVITKITHADQHIATLENERRTDKAALQAAQQETVTLKAEIQRLNGLVDALSKTTATPNAGTPAATGSVSKEDLVQGVVQVLDQRQSATVQATNLQSCMTKAQTVLGENYKVLVGEKAKTLGYTYADIDKLASTQPAVFEALFLPVQGQTPPATVPGNGTINPSALPNQGQPTNKPSMSIKGKTGREIAAMVKAELARPAA